VAEGGGWGEEFRHARAEPKRFHRLGIKTAKQNNFQFLLEKRFWRAETRSGANQAFFVQKKFEHRSVIATEKFSIQGKGLDWWACREVKENTLYFTIQISPPRLSRQNVNYFNL